MPDSEMTCPRNDTLRWKNEHLVVSASSSLTEFGQILHLAELVVPHKFCRTQLCRPDKLDKSCTISHIRRSPLNVGKHSAHMSDRKE